jgi:hypothetical protein
MRDLFERFRVPAKPGATRATGVTVPTKPNDFDHLRAWAAVARGLAGLGNMGNTGPSAERADGNPLQATADGNTDVALLPKVAVASGTEAVDDKSKLDKASEHPLPVLPTLPSERTPSRDVARAQALLAEAFERIAGWWIEGAELPPAELEVEIDRALLAGDLIGLCAALRVYEQAARDRCAAAARLPEGWFESFRHPTDGDFDSDNGEARMAMP